MGRAVLPTVILTVCFVSAGAIKITPSDWRQCPSASKCEDLPGMSCLERARSGDCLSNPELMDSHCRVSCGRCNQTAASACHADTTCCKHPFSKTGMGCCPFKDGICCNNGFTCCPSGTRCIDERHGAPNSVRTSCVNPSTREVMGRGHQICRPGLGLPLSRTQKNCIIIGDSVSVGYTEVVASLLNGTCAVQHSPFADGPGSGSAEYGFECLDNFLRMVDGQEAESKLDLIFFNWGLHNVVVEGGWVVPGNHDLPEGYLPHLTRIVKALNRTRSRYGTKLLFGLTTPSMCDAEEDTQIKRHNEAAQMLMAEYNVSTVDLHGAVTGKCGASPRKGCFGMRDGGCPHYNNKGYAFIARRFVEPAMRKLLMQ